MSYKLSITLTLTFLLSACTTASSTLQKTNFKEKKVKEVKVEEIKNIINVDNNTKKNIKEKIPNLTIINEHNIEGNYILERGQISFGDIRKTINKSNLVIEKLDDDNFGFYYTVQVEEHVPDEYFGIFFYKDGKFVQKVISDGGEVNYYDNIELIKENNRLKLTIKTNQGKRIIIWDKVENITPSQELLSAEKSYTGVCKAKYNELIFK